MDTATIGANIATRFDGATAPSGYPDLQLVTAKRQKGLGKLPALIVYFNGYRDLEYGHSRRKGVMSYSARFYYALGSDVADVDAGLQAWHDVLIDRLLGQLMLGEGANGVTGAYIRSSNLGVSPLGGNEYAVIDFGVDVEFTEEVTFTA